MSRTADVPVETMSFGDDRARPAVQGNIRMEPAKTSCPDFLPENGDVVVKGSVGNRVRLQGGNFLLNVPHSTD
jgi:hypothetical protein